MLNDGIYYHNLEINSPVVYSCCGSSSILSPDLMSVSDKNVSDGESINPDFF